MSSTSHVLLYAPELFGHPQVYCAVIGRVLIEAGCDVTVAAGHDAGTVWDDWHALAPLRDEPRMRFEDTRGFSAAGEPRLTAEEFRALQQRTKAEATLFIEGDRFEEQFRRIGTGDAPPLRGRNCAIFANTCLWYPGEDPYTGLREPILGPTVRRTLGRLKRRLFERKASARYFYETVLAKKGVVDAIITKDERVTEAFGEPFHCMPEIYRVFEPSPDRRLGDWDRHAEPIRRLIERGGAENAVLFFGAGAYYKGYDLFLKFLHLEPSAYGVHAGIRGGGSRRYMYDVRPLRRSLLDQGRLYETDGYVESDDLIDLLFQSIERFVSTHRLTLSSGTVLQALEAGKPVLTPDRGLVGWRTEQHGLGMTYAYLDAADLADKWRAFRATPADSYRPAIDAFMQRFSRERVTRFFTRILLEGGAP